MIYDELVRILNKLLQKNTFKRFPALKERFYNVVIAFFKKAMQPSNKLVSDLIAAEACYVNTGHPDFITGHKAMAVISDRVNASKQPAVNLDLVKGGRGAPQQPAAPLTNAQALPNPSATINQGLIEGDANSGFFGSFFSKKKKPGVLENVGFSI